VNKEEDSRADALGFEAPTGSGHCSSSSSSSRQSGAYVHIACDGFFAALHFLLLASFVDSLSIIIIITVTFCQFLFFQAAFSTTTIGSTRQQGASEVRGWCKRIGSILGI
jgi:hypothetical protein